MALLLVLGLIGLAAGQSVGTMSKEVHPKLTTWECTKEGCEPKDTAVVLDSLSHPVHQKDSPSLGCGAWGSGPPASVCPDVETCQANCVMEGISDYTTAGVYTEGGELTLHLLRPDGSLTSPRIYLLSESEKSYEMLKLTGREFSFDVDTSKLPCGTNGALYLSEMDEFGAQSELNTGGAAYGTGYCDAQCFTTPFINGIGNIDAKGSCCNEMDIWEANARSNSIAPHPCEYEGLYLCEGEECEFDGVCDKWGCSYNPYKVGHDDYYGLGMKVDTKRPFTVVTQFPTDEEGNLIEIHRLYVQDGKVIENAQVTVEGLPEVSYTTEELCNATVGEGRFIDLGGHRVMGDALSRGMVLAFSVWWDEGGQMTWLDSEAEGAGPCGVGEGAPSNIRKVESDPTVVFSNIKWGEIGTTYNKE